MSVEKQTDEATNMAIKDQQKSILREESMHTAASSGSTSVQSENIATPTATALVSNDVSSAKVRTWFESLSLEEQISAIGFVDGPFVAGLAAMVSAPPDEAHVVPDGKIDWEATVSIKDVQDWYSVEDKSEMGSDKDVEGPSIVSIVDDESLHQASMAMDASSASDVFRIPTQQSKSEVSALSGEARQLLDSMCCIFPSAFHRASGSTVDERSPYVFVSPLFEGTSEELFQALDSMGLFARGKSFFSLEEMSTSSRVSWLRHLGTSAFSEDAVVPLYALLFARLEFAGFESYSEQTAKLKSALVAVDLSPVDNIKNSRGEEDSTIGQYASAFENECSFVSDFDSKTTVNLLKDVRALASLLQDDSSDDLGLSFTPFVDKYVINGNQDHARLVHNMLFMPFAVLGKAWRVERSLVAIDQVLSLCLVPRPRRDRLVDGESDPEKAVQTAEASVLDVLAGSAHKKKRKKHKRKKQQSQSQHGLDVKSAENQDSRSTTPQSLARVSLSPQSDGKSLSGRRAVTSGSKLTGYDRKTLPSVAVDDSDKSTSGDSSSNCDSSYSGSDLAPHRRKVDGGSSIEGSIKDVDGRLVSSEVNESDDLDDWETVGKGGRMKAPHSTSRALNYSSASHLSIGSSNADSASKKVKSVRTAASRKTVNRKIVRDVLFAVLDTVDEEVRKRQQKVPRRAPTGNQWMQGPPSVSPVSRTPQQRSLAAVVSAAPVVRREPTMRDVVLGRHMAPPRKSPAEATRPSPNSPRQVLARQDISSSQSGNTDPQSPSKSSTSSRVKSVFAIGADQNTAPTYQETVSATSNIAVTAGGSPSSLAERASKSDLSSADTDEAPQNKALTLTSETRGKAIPPLPILLSPENANSANSSVASSLEVPHSIRRHHHGSALDVNDVGYHLLDVCDRLSRDMSLFMTRRAQALNARRRERGALLAALQDSVASIWPGHGHVEMYGSCATQLDLPSSDLDVVIIGLDRQLTEISSTPSPSLEKSFQSEGVLRTFSLDELNSDDTQRGQASPLQRHMSMGAFMPMTAHMNAERVMRLAAELESQPWAVQVNAIPTASVPVVKILADPSKLTGASTNGEWMLHHPRLSSNSESVSASGAHPDARQLYQPPWRGADVMNGLLKLDITFEGPEHGGIGSTQFSARVIAEACHEAGVHPDSTSLVQVVMVLKEMLAQRKLNEPYSGGLSSYALLLLVLALIRERAFIRQEIDRADRQRKAMSSGEVTSAFSPDEQDRCRHASRGTVKSLSSVPMVQDSSGAPLPKKQTPKTSSDDTVKSVSVSSQKSIGSSWASIAKKNSNALEPKDSTSSSKREPTQVSKPVTFADAVVRQGTRTSAPSTSVSVDGKGAYRGEAMLKKSNTMKDARSVPSEVGQNSSMSDLVSKGTGLTAFATALSIDTSLVGVAPLYPQGYNDVIEVLCSGEPTAGKLLMHFLLYYGQHFDAQTTAIDISGKHERDIPGQASPYSYFSPYIQRRSPGRIDPVTGMLTVDPIVIYDPLEGAENNNVARRCFAWSSVRWVFAQGYATLSSAVERSATPPATPGGNANWPPPTTRELGLAEGSYDLDADLMDSSSPLLRCLLSF